MTQQLRARGDRPCPVCKAAMTLARKGKVEIDVCEVHGVWLDVGELEAITRRVEDFERALKRGAIRRTREEATTRGIVSGWLFGPLAMLFTGGDEPERPPRRPDR